MKKTLTINLNNTVFHIDDDAYELLQSYLAEVSHHFKSEAEKAAQGLAALIDGFWLRGALISGEIDPEMPIELCSQFIQQQLKSHK